MTDEVRVARKADIYATCKEVIGASTLDPSEYDLLEKRNLLLKLLSELESGNPLTEAELSYL